MRQNTEVPMAFEFQSKIYAIWSACYFPHTLEKSSEKNMQFNMKIFHCWFTFFNIFFIFHSLAANWNSTAKRAFKSCKFTRKCSHTLALVSHWLCLFVRLKNTFLRNRWQCQNPYANICHSMSIQIEKDILSLNMIIDCTNDVDLRIVYVLYCMCSVYDTVRLYYIVSGSITLDWIFLKQFIEEQKSGTFV